MSVLSRAYFHDEQAAFDKLESLLWPNGPVCPKCGGNERIYELKGATHRMGLKKCGHCRRQFTVTVGTVFESSHVPLHKWIQACYLMASSKKGISSNQLARTLEVTVKTGWFMSHRIREAMREGALDIFGTGGNTVEVDETYIGRDKSQPKGRGYQHKHKVLALVERETGRARSMVVEHLSIKTVTPILQANIDREAKIMTDQAGYYRRLGDHFAKHGTVNHEIGEYARGPIHTNTIEGFFSIFKRGMRGVYQHCSKRHLHRYLAEFDFRYNHRAARDVTDDQRADLAILGIVGKRLTYRDSQWA